MKVSKRTWIARDGKRHTAWGFTGVTRPDGKKTQVRVFEEWNRETAVKEMMKYDWQGTVRAAEQAAKAAAYTFAQACETYLADRDRRTLDKMRKTVEALKLVFGPTRRSPRSRRPRSTSTVARVRPP
jgi:hypothetical protein